MEVVDWKPGDADVTEPWHGVATLPMRGSRRRRFSHSPGRSHSLVWFLQFAGV